MLKCPNAITFCTKKTGRAVNTRTIHSVQLFTKEKRRTQSGTHTISLRVLPHITTTIFVNIFHILEENLLKLSQKYLSVSIIWFLVLKVIWTCGEIIMSNVCRHFAENCFRFSDAN